MFEEITLLTLSMLGASFIVPYCIPGIRAAKQQIETVIKTHTVFTSSSITDIQQAQINMIDRTIGQIIGAFCQFIITGWVILSLFTSGPIDQIHNFIISYYLYDMIHLYSNPYGKELSIFFVHHTLTICLITYIRYAQIEFTVAIKFIYLLMESSSFSINITNSFKQFYPASRYIMPCSAINVMVYGLTRVFAYPLILGYYEYELYTSDINTKYLYIFPNVSLSLLYCVSIWWFIIMVQKHRRTSQKTIL